MASNTILISGSSGQLGSELKELVPQYPQFSFVFLDRNVLPLEDEGAMRKAFEQHHPDFFINCAAYTAVDKAESEQDLANKINGEAVGTLAAISKEFGTKLIHISTDYVFSGQASAPLKETDGVDPVNAYGASKLLGEKLAIQSNPESIIIRTSWVYSFYGKNFVKTMMQLMGEKESIGVVNDQIGSPTYAADLAQAIMQIILSGKWQPGIYHFSNDGVISWFDFAEEIKSLINSSCLVSPLDTAQFPTPAKRPGYSVMDKTKIQETFGVQLKPWKESLRTCVHRLQQQNT